MVLEIDFLVKIVLSLVLGGLIGLEREKGDEPAGFRTHMLICLGATLFTIISVEFAGATDPSRIAAGLVTGIGFLGAGAIFKAQNHIKGLTTAADLWVLTAIGMTLGIGYYFEAIISTAIVFIVLSIKKVTKSVL